MEVRKPNETNRTDKSEIFGSICFVTFFNKDLANEKLNLITLFEYRSIPGGKTNERSTAGTSENNAITASVAGLSIHEAGTENSATTNAATYAFANRVGGESNFKEESRLVSSGTSQMQDVSAPSEAWRF